MFYEWDNLESFNVWHDQICQSLKIPDEQTIDYTKPIVVEGKVIAVVHDSEAMGLTPTDLRPPKKIGEQNVDLS